MLKTGYTNLTTRCFVDDHEGYIRLYTWWNQRPEGHVLNKDRQHLQTLLSITYIVVPLDSRRESNRNAKTQYLLYEQHTL